MALAQRVHVALQALPRRCRQVEDAVAIAVLLSLWFHLAIPEHRAGTGHVIAARRPALFQAHIPVAPQSEFVEVAAAGPAACRASQGGRC